MRVRLQDGREGLLLYRSLSRVVVVELDVAGEEIGPAETGPLELAPGPLGTVALVDAARVGGFTFKGLRSPGVLLASGRSEARAAAARVNGAKGGRPRKPRPED